MSDSFTGSLKAHFLVAMPILADPNFHRTVTCICEHSDKGAMGIVVNRLVPSLQADKIFQELNITATVDADAIPIFTGGPVHMNEIFILHGPPFGWRGTFMISPTLALSNTMDLLEAIARGTGPSAFIITLGSAGWGPGQLEGELKESAWLTLPVVEEIIFDTPVEDRWTMTMRRMGIDPAGLTDKVGHA